MAAGTVLHEEAVTAVDTVADEEDLHTAHTRSRLGNG